MYQVLNADYVLATVLASTRSVSFDALDKLRRNIEASCPGLAVDVSSSAINSAIECYPDIFERQPEKIVRAANAGHYLESEYINWKFTNRVPKEVHQFVEEAINKVKVA